MDKEAIIKKQAEIIAIEMEIEHQRKRIDWFDYQLRGGRFEKRSKEEITEDKETLIEAVKVLEKKLSEAYKSD